MSGRAMSNMSTPHKAELVWFASTPLGGRGMAFSDLARDPFDRRMGSTRSASGLVAMS